MVASDGFAEFLREQLAPLGRITMRRMFGKTGVFCDRLMFAMVTEDTLYFRVDDDNRAVFKEAESVPPLNYEKQGRMIDLSFWRAPERLLDEPGVSSKRRGLPSASTSAWIFVLNPPRLRPSAWSSTFFESAGAVLMSLHDGAVDHRVLVIAIGCQVLKDALPYAGFGPAAEPPVRILPVAEALRQVAPWCSPVQNRLDKPKIVTGGCTDVAQLTGKQVPNPFPWIVANSIAGHASAFYKADLA
jgi:DNA transformation protein and related proteins